MTSELANLSVDYREFVSGLDERLKQATNMAVDIYAEDKKIAKLVKGKKTLIKQGKDEKRLFRVRSGQAYIAREIDAGADRTLLAAMGMPGGGMGGLLAGVLGLLLVLVIGIFAFTVRVEQNGQFFSTADLVEDGDDLLGLFSLRLILGKGAVSEAQRQLAHSACRRALRCATGICAVGERNERAMRVSQYGESIVTGVVLGSRRAFDL